MTITRFLRRAASVSADVRAVRRSVQTGSPKPLVRRGKNRLAGRMLGRLMGGFWKWPR